MGRIKMPSSSDIDTAYRESIGRVPDRYKKGVQATEDWQTSALAGQANYEEQMSKAEVLKRRAEKLAEVSDSEWKAAAANKGSRNIGPGMRDGADKRTRNYENIRTKLDGMDLPDRTTDFETNIDQRVKPVVRAMKEAAGKL